MATVVKARINSSRGTAYEAFLDNGAPSEAGLLLDSKASTINYELNSQDPDGHVMGSKATIQFRITNGTEKAVFDGLVEANELQYRLRIHREGVLIWVGFVLLEQVTSDFSGYPYFFKVGATDGLSRLKDIEYQQSSLPEFATIKEHLFNILEQVPLEDYYATEAEYLRINSTLYPQGMTPGASVNTLGKIRLGFKALRTVDKQGEITYVSCYDALLEILGALNGRIIFSQGRYQITEINSYARPLTATTFFRYAQDGSSLTPEEQLSWVPSTVQIGSNLNEYGAVALANGKVSYLPPLREVDYTYKHYSRQNLFPGITWNNLNSSVAEISGFDGDAGAGKLAVSANVSYTITEQIGATSPPGGALWVAASVLIAIENASGSGGKSLKRTARITPSGVSYDDAEWVDGTAATYDFFFPAAPPIAGITLSNAFSFISPVVPQGGTLQLALRLISTSIRDSSGAFYGAEIAYTYSGAYVESLLSGSISGNYNYTRYRPQSGASGFNSVVLERELLFGDGPGDNTFGRIEYTEDGITWQRTNLWRRWSGGSYLQTTPMYHSNLIAEMILALQDTPREQLDITVISPTYHPTYMLGCNSKLYLMKSGQLTLDDDQWRGRWFEIAENFTDLIVEGTDYETNPVIGPDNGGVNEPYVPPAGGGGYVPPTTGGNPGITAPAINTVTNSTSDEILVENGEISNLPVNNLLDVPVFAGDIITLTNPTTGETMDVEAAYDSGFIVGQMTDPGAVPYFTATDTVWLVPSTTEISIVPITPTADFPAGSYIQPNAQSTAQLQGVLRSEYKEAHLFGYDETIPLGYTNWFWRPELRQGQHIRKVHFAFAQDMGGTVKINLKYFDATGERYTVATYNGGGLGGVETALADVLEGYYRIQVESSTGTRPKGLTVFIEYVKTRD